MGDLRIGTSGWNYPKGRGTWNSAGPSQLTFGPLAMTRAKCPKGSLHDQIVRQWPHIVSYVMRDGHLFLALKMDSGIYEFEPVSAPPPKPGGGV